MMLATIQNYDEAFFLLINNRLSTPLLDGLMTLITVAGDSVVWIGFGALAILMGDRHDRKRRYFAFLLIMAIAGLGLNIAKEMVLRERPLHRFKQSIDAGTVIVKTPYHQLVSRSFPSGHSQAAFTAATFFVLFYRRYRILLYAAAFLVAFSRVYLGVHFPIDAIVGSAIGWLFAYAGWRLYCGRYEDDRCATIA